MPKRQQPKQPKKPKLEKVELVPQAHSPPEVSRFLEKLREAVGRVLDLADAAAEALTKALRPRA